MDQQTQSGTIAPLFSIIIPLDDTRGQWERSWLGWQSQTLDKADYEIILIVPPNFPKQDELSALVGSNARLEYATHLHDIGLCAVGAERARGKYLLLTESHCWPEPDVLELCLQAFRDNPDWAGLSCRSVPVVHNRLSQAEADMYQADIEFGMKVHPWLKLLDQCFVTRREVYEQCGGLRAEFGHFAEWVLAAVYYALGHKIGYLDEARFHHYYVGAVGDLKTFTLDFVQGEIRYFSQGLHEPGSDLLEVPPEWICQDNFNPDMARGILRMTTWDVLAAGMMSSGSTQRLLAIGRWASPAIFGDGLARGASIAAAVYARLVLTLVRLAGSRESIAGWLKRYIAALIRYQRLASIRTLQAKGASATARNKIAPLGTPVRVQTGFYPLERQQDRAFRWSETEAAIQIRADSGPSTIRLVCLPVRQPLDKIDLRFYLDERRIPDDAVSKRADGCEIQFDLPPSGTVRLGWVCRPFHAVADPRRLGLPIMHVEVISHSRSGQSNKL